MALRYRRRVLRRRRGGRKRLRSRSRSRRRVTFKRRALVKIGQRVGTTNVKCTMMSHNLAPVLAPSKTITETNCCAISQDDALFQRQRACVNLRGIKIRFFFQNNFAQPIGTPSREPVGINVALVRFKNSTGGFPNTLQFFRAEGDAGGDVRNQDFIDYTGLSGMDYYTKPLSTDTLDILWHTRFTLGAANINSDLWSSQNPWRKLSRYIKISRQITFNSNLSTDAEDRIYLLHWGSGLSENAATPISSCYQFVGKVVTYWREPEG